MLGVRCQERLVPRVNKKDSHVRGDIRLDVLLPHEDSVGVADNILTNVGMATPHQHHHHHHSMRLSMAIRSAEV